MSRFPSTTMSKTMTGTAPGVPPLPPLPPSSSSSGPTPLAPPHAATPATRVRSARERRARRERYPSRNCTVPVATEASDGAYRARCGMGGLGRCGRGEGGHGAAKTYEVACVLPLRRPADPNGRGCCGCCGCCGSTVPFGLLAHPEPAIIGGPARVVLLVALNHTKGGVQRVERVREA